MARTVVFEDRGKWRVRVVDRLTGRTTTYKYPTEGEAREAAPRLRRQYARPIGIPIVEALAAYKNRLEAKGNRAMSVETTIGRLQNVFGNGDLLITGELTPATARELWETYSTTPGKQTKRVPSVSTRSNVLNECRTFGRWLLEKGWVKQSLLADVVVEGKRGRGKRQLDRVEDARRFLGLALQLGAEGDAGATAAATALLLGLRASEIANAAVRDLDDGGRILIVREAKTAAGNRRVQVPEQLRSVLVRLAGGRQMDARLFGDRADRFWVRHAVRRVCRLAGVPVISAHGCRGTHASLAVSAGVSGLAVASSLGHETFEVTRRHYATASSISSAQVDRVVDALH